MARETLAAWLAAQSKFARSRLAVGLIVVGTASLVAGRLATMKDGWIAWGARRC